MSEDLYTVKMRSSKEGAHISGAERIVPVRRLGHVISEMFRRAIGHERGEPDFLNIKVEKAHDVQRIKALKVVECPVRTPEEGWARVETELERVGVKDVKRVCSLFGETYSMRGAMLLDADTLARLEPDKARGIRATNMDGAPSPRADVKNHFAEALTLASKVIAAPGIVAEICVSDDPGYVTGYVATEHGYFRISRLKEPGSPNGGRIFLYKSGEAAVANTIDFLERQTVLVEHDGTAQARTSSRETDLTAELAEIERAGLKRTIRLFDREKAVSFASNDYLGLSQDERVKKAAARAVRDYGAGAGASRLVTGTMPPHLQLEAHLARFKQTDAAIVYSTGYMANLGAITAIAGRGDVVFSDALNHASIIDACRLSGAEVVVYPHLDMDALERELAKYSLARRVLVVSDGVFSMDGDVLDLPRFLEICRKHNAFSMVDEAHSVGVLGKTGHGLAEHFGCAQPDIAMGTLSKALGSAGGYIAAIAQIVEYLRQKSRAFIFNTAPVPAAMAAADEALTIIEEEPSRVERLHANIRAVSPRAVSAIIPFIIGDEAKAVETSRLLETKGFIVPAIRYPTVARGSARLRIAISAAHTLGELSRLKRELAAL